jgi:hypothetical protein
VTDGLLSVDAIMARQGLSFVETGRLALDLPLADLTHVQFPEFSLNRRRVFRRAARRLAGDWDQVLERDLQWSSAYEADAMGRWGMIPLQRYGFYRALQDRFQAGKTWEDTGWYQWIVGQVTTDPVHRYGTAKTIRERLDLLERMHAAYAGKGSIPPDGVRPVVNIGREGRVSIEDGRHRLCVAKVAGAKSIAVTVCVLHIDAQIPQGGLPA